MQISPPLVSIIIPNWNGAKLIGKVLDSILNQSFRDIEVIVVDNGSTDSSLMLIRNNYPSVRVIANGKNVGFARACNIGLAAAQGKYLVFWNNDAVASPTWVSEIKRTFERDTRVGVAGSIVTYRDGETVWCAGGGLDFVTGQNWMLMKGERSKDAKKRMKEVDYVPGVVLMTKRDLLTKIGGFDEHMFMYTEDMDLCSNVIRMGYKCVVQTQVYAIHYVSQSRNAFGWENSYNCQSNSILHFIFRQLPLRMIATSVVFQTLILPLSESLIFDMPAIVLIIRIRALWENLRRLRETMVERRRAKNLGQLPDGVRVRQLFSEFLRCLKRNHYEW